MTFVSSYSPDICEKVEKLLSDGLSKNAVMGKLRIPSSNFYKWIQDRPEFAQAVEFGVFVGQSKFEEQGRAGMWIDKESGKQLNNGYYMFTMKSQYKITDEQPKKPDVVVNVNDGNVKEAVSNMLSDNEVV